MLRRKLLAILALPVLALAVSACSSFTPVYGTHSAVGAQAMAFNFAPPSNVLERIVIERLKRSFPEAGPGAPLLTVRAYTSSVSNPMSNAIAVGRQVGVRVEARVTITQGETELFEATRFADGAYQDGRLTPTDRFSLDGAQEVAAEAVAESLRAAILSTYRPALQ